MKITLTESQLIKILSEISNNDLLNNLLDKVLEHGFESLTPNEKLRLRQLSGEKVEIPREPEPVNVPVNEPDEENEIRFASLSFIDNFPSDYEISIGNRLFKSYINDIEYADVDTDYELNENNFINFSDGEITVKLIPFVNGTRNFLVISDNGFKKTFKFNSELPKNNEETSLLIRFFKSHTLPKLLQEVIAHHNKKELP